MSSIFSNSWIVKLETLLTPSITKFQKKTLSANVNSTGIMTDLTFSNLEIGKTYRIGGWIQMIGNSGALNNNEIEIDVKCGGVNVGHAEGMGYETSWRQKNAFNDIFVATGTTLTFDVVNVLNSYIYANAPSPSNITLEELPEHQVTTDWT